MVAHHNRRLAPGGQRGGDLGRGRGGGRMGGVARQTLTRPVGGYRGPARRDRGRPDAPAGSDRGDEATVAPVRTRPAVAAPSARDCVAGVARQATSEGLMTEAREKPRTSGDGFAHQAVEDAGARERAPIAPELPAGIAPHLPGPISPFKLSPPRR